MKSPLCAAARKTGLARSAGSWQGWLLGAMAMALLAFAPPVAAQTGQITGTVADAQSGAPIGEVQVYLVGETLGALSRADGRFLIVNVPAGSYELRAERIGYAATNQTVQVTAGGTTTVEFRLGSQALGLDEIVVTGTAGAARRREIGNSITQLNVTDIPDRPTQVTDLLQGSAPGVEITGGSGEAGQGKVIRLRGNSSVSMTNQPIIYIDGVRMRSQPLPIVNSLDTGSGRGGRVSASPLDNINPNDIDRIEVIKGSAATTLFGTEASAGVIQVFTKRGSSGAPVWTAEVQQGTGWTKSFGMNGVDYLNMEHFMRDPWWGGGYEGGELSQDCINASTPDDAQAGDVTFQNERWESANSSADGACSFPGAVWLQSYDLSVRGGGENLQYFLSGGYENNQLVMPQDSLERYSFRGNFTMSPIENLQVQWNTGWSWQWNKNTSTANNAQGVTLNAFRAERNYAGSADPRRFASVLDYDAQQQIERLSTGITLTYTPLADLTNRFTVGYDFTQQEGRNLRPFGFEQYPEGSLTSDTWQNRILTFDYVGTYSFPLTDIIRSNFSWGGQAVGDEQRRVQAYGENFPGAAEPTISSASLTFAQESREKVWNAGFFFQNVFDIDNKYFITAGVRVDGNSAFGSGFGLQTYPKVSGSWVLSDESFWPEAGGSVKLRAAYGQSGRAPGAFDAVRTWNASGFAQEPAFTPDNLGNPDLGPEVTAEWEVGFDGAWLDNRVDVIFTYYNQKTTDALMNVAPIPSNGFTNTQLRNVGTLGNTGIELQVNAAVIETADWGVDLGVGVTTNNSKVISLCRDENDASTCIPEFNALGGRIIEGQPIPVNYDRRVADPNSSGPSCCGLTSGIYENDGDQVVIGPQLPTHTVTPSLSIRMPAGISLTARGEYRGGNMMEVNPISISRSVRSPLCFPYYTDPANSIDLQAGIPNLWVERCTPSGGRDYWFDADYFKLRSVSASIPVDFAFPDRISSAMLTLALNNAWDWYREVPWYDTEITGNGSTTTGLSEEIGGATERLPAPATFRISLRVTF